MEAFPGVWMDGRKHSGRTENSPSHPHQPLALHILPHPHRWKLSQGLFNWAHNRVGSHWWSQSLGFHSQPSPSTLIFSVFSELQLLSRSFFVSVLGTREAPAWVQKLPLCLKYPCWGTFSSLSSVFRREGCPWEQLYLCGTFLVFWISAASPPSVASMMAHNHWWLHRIVEHPELEGNHGDHWNPAPGIPVSN